MDKNHIDIGNDLLGHLHANNGESDADNYYNFLSGKGYSNHLISTIVDYFVNELLLINYKGKGKYFIYLTQEGYKASELKLENYLNKKVEIENLEIENKIVNIEGLRTANRNSKRALIIAVFVPLIGIIFQFLLNNYQNKKERLIKSEFEYYQDSIMIEKLKERILDDTLFLRELRSVVNISPTSQSHTLPSHTNLP